MGHKSDIHYREIADKVALYNDFYMSVISSMEYKGRKIIHATWLCVMGLIETWDISRYDR